jgi:hypothetical protein
MIPTCQKPDPNPRPPRFKAPPGATDTHFHIFGREENYPFVLDRRFTPPDASVESYLHLHRTLGLSRACWCNRAATAPTIVGSWMRRVRWTFRPE